MAFFLGAGFRFWIALLRLSPVVFPSGFPGVRRAGPLETWDQYSLAGIPGRHIAHYAISFDEMPDYSPKNSLVWVELGAGQTLRR
jgi:hypothetical protein